MKYRFRISLLLCCVLTMPLTLSVSAADDPKAAKEQLRRLQQAQRKLEQEKTALAAQVSEADGKLGQARKSAARSERKNAELAEKVKAVEETRDQLAAKLAETEKHVAEQAEANRLLAAEGLQLKAALSRQEQATVSCETKNVQLYGYGRELLVRYQNKDMWDGAAQREPFTGLKRVEIENVLEEYRDKLDNQKIAAPVPAVPSEARPH
jgi:chromosome segregation ATPase